VYRVTDRSVSCLLTPVGRIDVSPLTPKSIPQDLVERLYRDARADRWSVPVERFAAAIQASADRAAAADVGTYLQGLHLEDLALACACMAGDERAWEHFVREHRPVLYRAADALRPGGGARDLADSIYADLYGLQERDGERRSLFRYFHGRSSLATWLRAVLAQRVVDAGRAERRVDPLPEEDGQITVASRAGPAPDPDRARYAAWIQRALGVALSVLGARDRLRLACYYSQELTLAETGRVLKEHEATVSRHLAKTRGTIRAEVERYLREEARLNDAQIDRCFECVLEDACPLDLGGMLRKDSEPDRSI
jgi:RNA polymerase sigma factor (sigma-70 family)